MGDKASADLSTLFDVGGIFGGVLAGYVSDVTGTSALPCAAATILSIPMVSQPSNLILDTSIEHNPPLGVGLG